MTRFITDKTVVNEGDYIRFTLDLNGKFTDFGWDMGYEDRERDVYFKPGDKVTLFLSGYAGQSTSVDYVSEKSQLTAFLDENLKAYFSLYIREDYMFEGQEIIEVEANVPGQISEHFLASFEINDTSVATPEVAYIDNSNSVIDNSNTVVNIVDVSGSFNDLSNGADQTVVSEQEAKIVDGFNQLAAFRIDQGEFSLRGAIMGKKEGGEKLKGTNSDDVIIGFEGKDKLIGRKGADKFVFDSPGEFGKKVADVVKDFSSKQGDQIIFGDNAFEDLGDPEIGFAQTKSEFKEMLADSIDFVMYQPKGKLYFNKNGDESGFGDGGLMAILKGKPDVDASSFAVM